MEIIAAPRACHAQNEPERAESAKKRGPDAKTLIAGAREIHRLADAIHLATGSPRARHVAVQAMGLLAELRALAPGVVSAGTAAELADEKAGCDHAG